MHHNPANLAARSINTYVYTIYVYNEYQRKLAHKQSDCAMH